MDIQFLISQYTAWLEPNYAIYYLVGLFVLSTAFTLWIFAPHVRNDYRYVAVIFSMLFIWSSVYISYQKTMGYPVVGDYDQNYELVTSYINQPNPALETNPFIVIWVLDSETIDSRPRAIEIPYSKEIEKKLRQAKQKRDTMGKKSRIRIKNRVNANKRSEIIIEIEDIIKNNPGFSK